MAFNRFVVLASVLLIQSVLGQFVPSRPVSAGNSVVNNNVQIGSLGLPAPNAGLAGLNVVSSGPLVVTSISPIGPSGLAVASENVIEGVLAVSGQLPYLSAVAFDGSLPTAGSGVATCGCGTGTVGIVSEGLANANANSNAGLGVRGRF